MATVTVNKTSLVRLFFSFFVAFIIIYAWDFMVHALILLPHYVATKDVWIDHNVMGGRGEFFALHQVAYALVFVVFYDCIRKHITIGKVGGKNCPYGTGIAFGGFLGLMSGITMAGFYAYLPITGTLALSWFIAEFTKGLIVGLVLAVFYPKEIK